MSEEKKPFHVVLEDGGFVADFDDLDTAKANAEHRNKQAQLLGIKARYTVKEVTK